MPLSGATTCNHCTQVGRRQLGQERHGELNGDLRSHSRCQQEAHVDDGVGQPDQQGCLDRELSLQPTADPPTCLEHQCHTSDDAAIRRGHLNVVAVILLLVAGVDQIAVNDDVQDADCDVHNHDQESDAH